MYSEIMCVQTFVKDARFLTFVCLRVRVRVRVRVRLRVREHVCVRACMRVYACICMHACVRECVWTGQPLKKNDTDVRPTPKP